MRPPHLNAVSSKRSMKLTETIFWSDEAGVVSMASRYANDGRRASGTVPHIGLGGTLMVVALILGRSGRRQQRPVTFGTARGG